MCLNTEGFLEPEVFTKGASAHVWGQVTVWRAEWPRQGEEWVEESQRGSSLRGKTLQTIARVLTFALKQKIIEKFSAK